MHQRNTQKKTTQKLKLTTLSGLLSKGGDVMKKSIQTRHRCMIVGGDFS